MRTKNLILRLIASLVLSATWVSAFLLVSSTSHLARIIGWVFLSGKALMALMTILGIATHPVTGWRIFMGRYQFDTCHFPQGLAQAILRFIWELPQLSLGYCYAQIRNIFGHIKRVDYLGGATYVIDDGRGDFIYKGMSLSCFINIWLTNYVGPNFEHDVRYSFGQILMHEFGHTKDSIRLGWLYLFIVGLPSLISVNIQGERHLHKDLYAEKWANRHAQRYFGIEMYDLKS